MRESAVEHYDDFPLRDLGMSVLRPVISRDIWLALDESHEDSRRVWLCVPLGLEPLSLEELTRYHRQLFYWLMIRNGACCFERSEASKHGPPIGLSVRN